jgi:hypothetical protein
MLTAHAVRSPATSTLFIRGLPSLPVGLAAGRMAAGRKAAGRIAGKAWTRVGARVPKFVFRGIHLSFTDSGTILGWRKPAARDLYEERKRPPASLSRAR